MEQKSGPAHVSQALSQFIALRGLARVRGTQQLQESWEAVAGPQIATGTRATGITRGVLQVGVAGAALMSELVSFHKPTLLKRLQKDYPDLRIRDIRFRLRSDLSSRAGGGS